MYVLMLVVFLTLQAILVAFDYWELKRHSRVSRDSEPLRLATVLFLCAVTGVFFTVQLAGQRLTPEPLVILDFARHIATTWAGTHSASTLPVWAAALLGIVLFYFAGLWDYLVHRYFSHSRWFWLTHEYHHLPRQVSILMPGIFARPFAFLPVALSTLATAASMYTLFLALDFPLWDLRPLLPALLVIALVLTASHSCFLRRFWRVHRVMQWALLTTPQEHLLHHGINGRGNYGNFTTLWDRLFGTYLDPQKIDLNDIRLGLPYDQDFLGTLTLGTFHLSPAQRAAFQISRFCNLGETVDSR